MAAGRVKVNGKVCSPSSLPPSLPPSLHSLPFIPPSFPSPPPFLQVAEPGTKVHPGDTLTLDNKRIAWEANVILPPSSLPSSPSSSSSSRSSSSSPTKELIHIKYWKPRYGSLSPSLPPSLLPSSYRPASP